MPFSRLRAFQGGGNMADDMLPSWKTEKEKTVDMKGALLYAKKQI
jgi:hypothetical protein